jgi:hypothetical protein
LRATPGRAAAEAPRALFLIAPSPILHPPYRQKADKRRDAPGHQNMDGLITQQPMRRGL